MSPDPFRDYQQILGWMLGQTLIIPAFEGLRQRDCLQLEASLGYIVSSRVLWVRVRPYSHRKRREEGGWEEGGGEEETREGKWGQEEGEEEGGEGPACSRSRGSCSNSISK